MFDFDDDTFELQPDADCSGGCLSVGVDDSGRSGAKCDGGGTVEKSASAGEVEQGRLVVANELEQWEPDPLKIEVDVEVEIRHMFRPEAEEGLLKQGLGTLGILFPVEVYTPGPEVARLAMNFVDALYCAHCSCRSEFLERSHPGSVLGSFSARICLIFKFLATFARLRFDPQARGAFQTLIDLLTNPDHGARAVAGQWLQAASDGGAAEASRLQQGMGSTLEACIGSLTEAQALLATADGTTTRRVGLVLQQLAERVTAPLEPLADGAESGCEFLLYPMTSKIQVLHLPEHLGPRVLVELRAALGDPVLPSELAQIRQAFGLSGVSVVSCALLRQQQPVKAESFAHPRIHLKEAHHERFWVRAGAVTSKPCRSLDEPLARLRPPGGVVLSCCLSFQAGERVYAFYDASQHPEGYRYACVRTWATAFPLVGLTSGWLPATVLGAIEPDDGLVEGFGRVPVRFDADFCDPAGLHWLLCHSAKGCADFDPQQLLAEAELVDERLHFRGKRRRLSSTYRRGLELSVAVGLVRRNEPPRPLLSIVSFRWYDYWSEPGWSDYMVTNDGMLVDLFAGPRSVRRQLLGEHEAYTVFIKDTEDLPALSPQRLRALLRGQNRVAWYFLWPVVCGKGARFPGSVGEREFFRFLQRMECGRIRTGWPHASHVYRLLCGKLWVPQMCLSRDFRVPPTTRVHYAEFRARPEGAARRALECLMRLRGTLWGKPPVPLGEFQGVAKLGFSWCGGDVLPFRGLDGLVANLERLFEQPQCEQTVCLVQERVPDVVGEYRVLCFYDKRAGRFRKEPVWVCNYARPWHHVHNCALGDFTVASATAVPQKDVGRIIFGGDAKAQLRAEEEALSLVDRWLLWLQTESCEPPQCTRIDFLVAHPGKGDAAVWTCEVGECGASLCSVEVHARNSAAINFAVQRDASGRFPVPLPEVTPRNYGWKS